MTYLFRVTDPYCVPVQTARANDIVLSAFEDLVGCALLSQQQRDQASLPLSTGGCGLKSPRLVKPAARISALLAFLGGGCDNVAVPLYARTPSSAAITPVLEDLTGLLGTQFETFHSWQGHDVLATADPSKWHQKHWTDAIGKAIMLQLLDCASPRDQARLLERTSGLGTAWMSVLPSAPLRTIINSDD